MNILMFTRLFYPHIGGVEKHTFEVGQELIAKGHTVTVITENSNNLPEKETYKKVLIHRVLVNQTWVKKFQIWYFLFKNISLIKHADIIHAHDVAFWYFPFRFIFPFKKFYVTFHGYETKFPPERNAILMRKVSEFLSRGNICIGSFIEKWYGTKANIISYGGVHPLKTKKLLHLAKKVKVVFIGRLENDTGILFYESLCKTLISKGIKIEFSVYGDGSLKDALEVGNYKGTTNYVNEVIQSNDIIFSSSYLSILDGLNHMKLVVSTYDNELKKDYLMQTPFKDFILIGTDEDKVGKELLKYTSSRSLLDKKLLKGKNWVNTQTWEFLANQYITLWKK